MINETNNKAKKNPPFKKFEDSKDLKKSLP